MKLNYDQVNTPVVARVSEWLKLKILNLKNSAKSGILGIESK